MEGMNALPAQNTSGVDVGPLELVWRIPRLLYSAAESAVTALSLPLALLAGDVARVSTADATQPGTGDPVVMPSDTAASTASSPSPTSAGASVNAAGELSGLSAMLGLGNSRNWGVIFSYMTSKWAVSCLAVALILNRTRIYAATRRRTAWNWRLRLALRIIPILLLLYELLRLLQALRCQTSPHYAMYKGVKKVPGVPIARPAAPLHAFSSVMLAWQDDMESCRSVGMMMSLQRTRPGAARQALKGSMSLLWPLFQVLCFGQFIETLYCTLEGREVVSETGMTVFEHSLAFAEAEAMVSHQLGWGPFGGLDATVERVPVAEMAPMLSPLSVFRRSTLLSRFNTTPEVLFVGVISALSHLTSQILGVLGLQGRFRLWTTGFWGLTFMAVLLWSTQSLSAEHGEGIDILRFPTVCIVAFVPHILFLMGIGICGMIYTLALLLLTLAPPVDSSAPLPLQDRFRMAQESLQANMYLPSLRISRHDDFFNALLKVGFNALTAASEAVFLNEGRPVSIRRWTWLEEDRMQEIEFARSARARGRWPYTDGSGRDIGINVAEGVGIFDEEKSKSGSLRSGYAREKSMKKLKLGEAGASRVRGDGVGTSERRGRTVVVLEFFRGISWLIIGCWATVTIKTLEAFGIGWRARWLTKLVYGKAAGDSGQGEPTSPEPASLDFWILSDEGVLSLPEDDNVDVEAEMRKRMRAGGGRLTAQDERELDRNIYGWWKEGGWFGELDSSGDYVPTVTEDDSSSVCSSSSAADSSDWDTDDDDGTVTPTKERPYPTESRSSPGPDLTRGFSRLSRLLDPKTPAQRQEAQILAHHLREPGHLTRSQYRQSLERERVQILTSLAPGRRHPRLTGSDGARPSSSSSSHQFPMTVDEEAEFLEHLILLRRRKAQQQQGQRPGTSSAAPSWSSSYQQPMSSTTTVTGRGMAVNDPLGMRSGRDDEDDNSTGPACVVCQTSPRTILVWPCRCLSLCEDCRLSLAMNNFSSCVCCRRDVYGFSRIYVP